MEFLLTQPNHELRWGPSFVLARSDCFGEFILYRPGRRQVETLWRSKCTYSKLTEMFAVQNTTFHKFNRTTTFINVHFFMYGWIGLYNLHGPTVSLSILYRRNQLIYLWLSQFYEMVDIIVDIRLWRSKNHRIAIGFYRFIMNVRWL